MRKLYVRIYFAVLASLAVFALAAGLLWRAFGGDGPGSGMRGPRGWWPNRIGGGWAIHYMGGLDGPPSPPTLGSTAAKPRRSSKRKQRPNSEAQPVPPNVVDSDFERRMVELGASDISDLAYGA